MKHIVLIAVFTFLNAPAFAEDGEIMADPQSAGRVEYGPGQTATSDDLETCLKTNTILSLEVIKPIETEGIIIQMEKSAANTICEPDMHDLGEKASHEIFEKVRKDLIIKYLRGA